MPNNLMPLPSGPDLFWIAVELAAMVASFAGLPMEARNVREGHPPTKWWHTVLMRRTAKRTATRKEFVATYRRVLTRRSWTGLALGVGILVITVVFILPNTKEHAPVSELSMVVVFLSQGVGGFLARRVLDSADTHLLRVVATRMRRASHGRRCCRRHRNRDKESTTTNTKTAKARAGLAAATAIVAGGLLALPSAHATANCTVPGPLLNLHHSSGYDVIIDASRASLGPRAVIRTPDVTSDGNVTSGGITGRTIDFTLGWPGTLAYDHFTGTVGADGIAHGTSIGTLTPINLTGGAWDSVDALSCS